MPRPRDTAPAVRRVAALVRKEALQVLRDPSSLLIGVVLPVLLLFLFGYGVSLDLQNIEVCVVVEQSTPDTTSFSASIAHSPFFNARVVRDRRQCEGDLVAGRVKGIVVLPASFSADAGRSDDAPIQILADGSDPNTAGLVQNYLVGLWENWLEEEQQVHALTMTPPVT